MNIIKKSLSSVVILTTFLLTTSAFAMDPSDKNFVRDVPAVQMKLLVDEDVKIINAAGTRFDNIANTLNPIFTRAASNVLSGLSQLFCSCWKDCIDCEITNDNNGQHTNPGPVSYKLKITNDNNGQHTNPGPVSYKLKITNDNNGQHTNPGPVSYKLTCKNYESFFNGALIYNPDPSSNEGWKTGKFSDLRDPSKTTLFFQDKYPCESFLITTDIRIFFNNYADVGCQILIVPHALLKDNIESSAQLFSPIMDELDHTENSINIFYRTAVLHNPYEQKKTYDSLINLTPENIPERNLHSLWVLDSERGSPRKFNEYGVEYWNDPRPDLSKKLKRFTFIPNIQK